MTTGTEMLGQDRRARRRAWRTAPALLLVLAAACGDQQRQGQGSSYLLVNALNGAPGSDPAAFSGTLQSDVITNVKIDQVNVPTIFNDIGQVRLALALKDPGITGNPTAPSTSNYITIDRYHVQYIRTDGRNAQGVDVPYAFDGGMTLTVGDAEVIGSFTLVRNIAKSEAPLMALEVNGVVLSTIAEVTFYGHDQTGRAVSTVARISIDFANFGDKAT